MRRGHSVVCRLRRNESGDMCNVYSPGQGQSPHSVSFLWHDPSWMPPLGQRRIQLSSAQAEGLLGFTFSLSHLRFPSLLSLSPCISPLFSHHPSSLTLSSSCLSLSLFFDSAHVIHSCISPFMHALSQGFNRGSMDGVVRIHKHIVFHRPTQEAKRVQLIRS